MAARLSLRRQLLWYLLLPVGVIALLSGGLQFYLARNFAIIAYDNNLYDTTATLAAQIQVTGGKASVNLPQVAWDVLRYDDYDKIFPSVKWKSGEMVAGDPGLPAPPDVPHRIGKPIFHDGEYQGEPVRIASLYIPMAERGMPGELLVQAAETLTKRRVVMRQILSAIILPHMILILLAAISVWIGTKRGLEPLDLISRALSNRSHRDLRPVVESDVPIEVQPLLQSINGLMQRLSQVIDAQQRFIANAAHQLRTPIAGLKTQTENAMRQTEIAAVHSILPKIDAGISQAHHLVNQLLTLARSEALSNESSVLKLMDLDRLARDVTADWVPVAVDANIDLGYEGPDAPIMITGNEALLRELMANILDNAIRYTPKEGRITVSLTVPPLQLSIEDSGTGIPEPELERVFERFYRVSEDERTGTGLGLAIVREIADAHGARVWASTAAGRTGTRVTIEFPSS